MAVIRKTILVVDDEPQVRHLVKSVFSHHSHRVLEASDGVAAVGVFERAGPEVDLLLTDIVMPRMSGVELASRLSSRCPDLRVIYMSGRWQADDVRREVESKGFGFLGKPFHIGELRMKVSELLEEPARKGADGETGSDGKAASAVMRPRTR
jgi:DNA-binding NtrC family response regulator